MTRSARRLALAMAALLLAAPAFGQGAPAPAAPKSQSAPDASLPDSADAYGVAADGWAGRHFPSTLLIVVKRGGRIVFERGDHAAVDRPTLIASLSKMITGLCVASLVRDGRLDFDAPMREALSGYFARNPAPADPRFLDVTVAQLLTHMSGLAGNHDGDPAREIIARLGREGRGANASIQEILAGLLKHKLKRAPGARHVYSNGGYVALGAVIEDRAKRPYEDYCRDAVMKPFGIESARLDPDWCVLSAMGGWTIRASDYLKLADALAPDHPFLGDKAKAWIRAMKKAAPMRGGEWYSLGLITHETEAGLSFSHGGQLNSRGVDARGKPVTAIVRATFARAADGTSLFAAFTPAHYDNRALNELRSAMGRATRAWRSFR